MHLFAVATLVQASSEGTKNIRWMDLPLICHPTMFTCSSLCTIFGSIHIQNYIESQQYEPQEMFD